MVLTGGDKIGWVVAESDCVDRFLLVEWALLGGPCIGYML